MDKPPYRLRDKNAADTEQAQAGMANPYGQQGRRSSLSATGNPDPATRDGVAQLYKSCATTLPGFEKASFSCINNDMIYCKRRMF